MKVDIDGSAKIQNSIWSLPDGSNRSQAVRKWLQIIFLGFSCCGGSHNSKNSWSQRIFQIFPLVWTGQQQGIRAVKGANQENLKNPLTSRVFRVVGASAAWETQKNYLQPCANRLESIGATRKAPDRILDFRASITIYLHISDFHFLEAAGHFGARYFDDQRSD